MNKNKMIFTIIALIVLWLISLLIVTLTSTDDGKWKTRTSWDFTIWILWDEVGKFQEYITEFKEDYPEYKNKTFLVESFWNEETYKDALTASMLWWEWPDMFLLNNSESSVLENQIMWIDPSYVSPNDFRLRFKPVFWSDLIVTDSTDETIEFLKGVPVWYEALGVYFNRKYFLRPSELRSWSDLAKEVKNIKDKYSNIIPIALWHGTSVTHAADIVISLFVAEWASSLVTTDSNQVKQVLWMYSEFWNKGGDNEYNTILDSIYSQKDIDFFVEWDVAAMMWYPRDLFTINEKWYQKSFLFAAPFPRFTWSEPSIAINYNYFVVNKDTIHDTLAFDMMKFMASEEWQEDFIEKFPYYLSPELKVEESMLEKKIHPGYNIVYKNFVEEDMLPVSYDVWSRNTFYRELENILDMQSGQEWSFTDLSSFVVCSTAKHSTMLNLSSPCK